MARQARLVSVFLAVAGLGLLQVSLAQAETVRYWAVICGVANYRTINDLNYTDDDARDFAAALQQYAVWQGPDQIEVLIDAAASKSGIRDAIGRMGAKAKANAADRNVFLFFFSGHGMQVLDNSPGDESDGIDEAICPWDTQIKGRTVSNVITDDEIGAWLAALPLNGEVVAIFDTCFSGGMADEATKGLSVKSVRNPNLPLQAQVRRHFGSGLARRLAAGGAGAADSGAKDVGGTNAVVLMACEEGGLSYETSSLQNGIFSYYLVEGLGGPATGAPADADGDDLLSAEEEFDYASLWTLQYPSITQVPRLFDGNLAKETVIVEPGAVPAPPIAAFAANPTSGPAPLVVKFTDQSTGIITNWSWDFGDETTSAEQNPTHTYVSPGIYTVVLTVTGPGGVDEATGTVSVTEAAPEEVTITKAEYKRSKQELTVQATSSAGGIAVLTVEGYGPMTYDKRTDTYKFQAKPVADPGGTVKVTSSLGGSATRQVTYK